MAPRPASRSRRRAGPGVCSPRLPHGPAERTTEPLTQRTSSDMMSDDRPCVRRICPPPRGPPRQRAAVYIVPTTSPNLGAAPRPHPTAAPTSPRRARIEELDETTAVIPDEHGLSGVAA